MHQNASRRLEQYHDISVFEYAEVIVYMYL